MIRNVLKFNRILNNHHHYGQLIQWWGPLSVEILFLQLDIGAVCGWAIEKGEACSLTRKKFSILFHTNKTNSVCEVSLLDLFP